MSLHPYHTTPHLVPTTSPDNLCKGRVMRDWLALESFDNVVYRGDGGNDFEGRDRCRRSFQHGMSSQHYTPSSLRQS